MHVKNKDKKRNRIFFRVTLIWFTDQHKDQSKRNNSKHLGKRKGAAAIAHVLMDFRKICCL